MMMRCAFALSSYSQARLCASNIAELMASELKVPIEAIGRLRGQAPVKPVPIGAIKRGAIHAAALGEVG